MAQHIRVLFIEDSPEDLELVTVTDDPEEAVRVVLDSYRRLFPDGDGPREPRKADAR